MEYDKLENSVINEFGGNSAFIANIQRHIALDENDIEYLRSIISIDNFRRRDILMEQGQLCRRIFFVASGSLRAYNLSKNGKEATIMFAVDDWWITDMYCFANQKPAMLSLEALEDSEVVVMNFDAFELLLQKSNKFERFFRILFQNAYAREQLRVLDAFTLTTEERYRQFVLKYPHIVEKVTQKQIASYLGVTPEFLSSVKKK